jgi:hypothetical protein
MKLTPPGFPAAPPARLSHRLFLFGVLAFALTGLHGRAQEPAAVKRAPMVEIEARFVRASLEQLRAAVGAKTVLTPEELEKALAALKAAKADFFSHSRAVTKSGRKAVIESVRELRYPSDYAPSEDDPKKFLPTAFDTRDVGVVLEFGPTETTNDELTLDFVVSVVNFLGFIDGALVNAELENKTPAELQELTKAALPEGAIWHPIFSTRKVTTNATLRSGQTWLFSEERDLSNHHPKSVKPNSIPMDFHLFITARIIVPK